MLRRILTNMHCMKSMCKKDDQDIASPYPSEWKNASFLDWCLFLLLGCSGHFNRAIRRLKWCVFGMTASFEDLDPDILENLRTKIFFVS
jgi:hypothetical protein